MGIMVYAIVWVMQDLYHPPYPQTLDRLCSRGETSRQDVWSVFLLEYFGSGVRRKIGNQGHPDRRVVCSGDPNVAVVLVLV